MIKINGLAILNRFTDEDRLLMAIFAPFYSAAINSGIVFMLRIDPTEPIFSVFRNLLYMLVAVLILTALPVALKRSTIFMAVSGVLLSFLLGFTQWIYPDNLWTLYQQGVLINTLGIVLPGFFYAYSIRDWSKFHKYMSGYAHFIIALSVMMLLQMLGSSVMAEESYSMSLGYFVMFGSLFFLQRFMNGFVTWDLFGFLIGMVTVLLIGSRGPLVCLLLFMGMTIFIRIWKGEALSWRAAKWIALAIILLSVFGAFLTSELLIRADDLLADANINSRTISMLASDKMSQDSGRTEIYDSLMKKINEQPFLGYGIGGDRMLVGIYAHNIFLALGVFFGIIGAMIAVIAGSMMIMGAFWLARGMEEIQLLIIFFSVYFGQSLFSGDILTNNGLWIVMGMSLNIIFAGVRIGAGKTGAAVCSEDAGPNQTGIEERHAEYMHQF